MAEIDRDRDKRGMGWMWGLLVLLLVALLAWWLWPDANETEFADVDPDTGAVPITPVTPEPVAEPTTVTISVVLADPDAYVGQAFPGTEVSVAEVPTDRGFWIEDDGQRLFALIVDRPQEQPLNIEPGQALRIEEGTLRDATFLEDMPGAPLDAETQEILDEQEVFLVVDEEDIRIVLESDAS